MLSTISLESSIRRILVEKRRGFDLEARALKRDLIESLHIDTIENIRILNRYDIEGIDGEVYENAAKTIFSEPNLDIVYHETLEFNEGERVFAIEYLPGQYDQRGDWAAQCIQIVNEGNRPEINTAKLYILAGNITDEQFDKILESFSSKTSSIINKRFFTDDANEELTEKIIYERFAACFIHDLTNKIYIIALVLQINKFTQ